MRAVRAHFAGMTTSPSSRSGNPTHAEGTGFPGMMRGTREYARTNIALFLAGFSTFSLLYCVQPLLPEFSRDFAIAPATSSLALSVTTGALAVAIFVAGAVSQGLPRRGLMFASMMLAALCNLAAAAAPTWDIMLVARLLCGLTLGGVPAVAMAYLAEEIRPADLGKAVGLYIAGTAFGGMAGRVAMGMLTEFTTWRTALAIMSVIGLASAAGFAALLPPSRNFVATKGMKLADHVQIWSGHLSNPVLRRLFAIGLLLTSIYVPTFSYTAFRLVEAPYSFGQAALSGIFLITIFGITASTMAGAAVDRYGRYRPLAVGLGMILAGTAVTLASSLVLILVGITIINAGFFVAHTVVSGWVGQEAKGNKGHASSLYLLFYYIGSSVSGVVGGWFWHGLGWTGVAEMMGAAALGALFLAVSANACRLAPPIAQGKAA